MNTDRLRLTAERLRLQDNRITMNPMFCVQILRRDVGFDSNYATNRCWWDGANLEAIYDDDPGFKDPPKGDQWDGPFGYQDRWEIVMVAFTEAGCEEHIALDGHNHKRAAFRGQVRIYVESFNRCPEMIAIREELMKIQRARNRPHAGLRVSPALRSASNA